MIKRIILIALLYILTIVCVTITVPSTSDNYWIILLVSNIIFAFLMGREIYKKYFVGFKPKDQNITYTNTLPADLIKISTKPFLFGLEKKLLSDEDFYFDNENFYVINKDDRVAKFDLKNITELSRTAVKINNNVIWQVKINADNRELIFKFAHNYSIWNKSFLDFYEKIKSLNPSAIKSKWSLWRM